jgi:hypothetical protein
VSHSNGNFEQVLVDLDVGIPPLKSCSLALLIRVACALFFFAVELTT